MNKTTRTQAEILNRIEAIKSDDFFGWQINDLIAYLEFEHAKQYLIEEATEKNWQGEMHTASEQIANYMEFAWDKANNCRGISAGRSIEHMKAWLWLDGKDDLAEQIGEYSHYGKPQLVAICREYGIDWKQYDDGEWVSSEGDTPQTAQEVIGDDAAAV